MNGSAIVSAMSLTGSRMASLPTVIDAIGEDRFGNQLLSFLAETCGAEHCAVFQFVDDSPTGVFAASLDGTDTARRQADIYIDRQIWRSDPLISEAKRLAGAIEPSLMRLDITSLPDNDLRNIVYGQAQIRERVFLCGGMSGSPVGLSLLRSEEKGAFSLEEIFRLAEVGGTLLSILAKHSGIVGSPPDLSVALTTLDEIEACIALAPEALPRREAEVCARILYGISTLGIALSLNIGEETVMTYRKRAYQRLGIGCQRELLLWYVALWSRIRCRGVTKVKQ